MRAVMINFDGMMKYFETEERSPYYRRMKYDKAQMYKSDYKTDEIIPVEEFRLERSYIDEFDKETLIYKQVA